MNDGTILLITFMLCVTLCYCVSGLIDYLKEKSKDNYEDDD